MTNKIIFTVVGYFCMNSVVLRYEWFDKDEWYAITVAFSFMLA